MNKTLKKVLIVLIPVLIIAIAGIITINLINRPGISLVQYVTVSTSGANTHGVASIAVDEIGLKNALMKNDNTHTAQEYDSFIQTVKCSANRKDQLSNGDSIKIFVTYSEEEAKKLNLKVGSLTRNQEITGLLDCVTVDLFCDLKIITSGISPFVSVSYVNESTQEYVKNIEYEIDHTKKLSIGDTIHILAKVDKETANEEGYDYETDSMDYTIAVADSYVTKQEQLPNEEMVKLQTQDLAAITELTNDTTTHMIYEVTKDHTYLYQDGNEEAVNFSYIGTMIAMDSSVELKEKQNIIFLFYKGQIRKPDYSDREDPYNYTDAVFCFAYQDAILSYDNELVLNTDHPEKRYICSGNLEDCRRLVLEQYGDAYEYNSFDFVTE